MNKKLKQVPIPLSGSLVTLGESDKGYDGRERGSGNGRQASQDCVRRSSPAATAQKGTVGGMPGPRATGGQLHSQGYRRANRDERRKSGEE